MKLIHGDCLVELKKIKENSIDFVYLDLPFGQTACKWDKKIDHHALWIELKRIAKSDRTPFFFSCTTKFGFELFNTAPKGYFRWDLVWEKNRAAGFLNAYRLPMRKHEMVYCFAKKTPEYDVSSHSEYVEETGRNKEHQIDIYGKKGQKCVNSKTHKDPLPTSVLPPQEESDCFTYEPQANHELVYCFAKKTPEYDVSSHKFHYENNPRPRKTEVYAKDNPNKIKAKIFYDPLPTSVLPPQDNHELVYCFAKKSPDYDVSSHLTGEEVVKPASINDKYLMNASSYHCCYDKPHKGKVVKDALPTSVLPPQENHELVYCFAKKSPNYDVSSHLTGEEIENPPCNNCIYTMETSAGGKDCFYKPFKSKVLKNPLPTSVLPPQENPSSWCKFKNDEKVNHRTAKPVKLMEFLLKYWSKEGDTVLDPTAGSGSMGIACLNMNRKFIGIEMDNDIYQIMKDRIENHQKQHHI